MTLLAVRAGVPTREVVTASQAAGGDALLVLRGSARPLGELTADELDDELLRTGWRAVGKLGDAGIAHLQIDPSTVAVAGEEVWLLDFDAATPAPTPDQLQTDRVQLLAATAAFAGKSERSPPPSLRSAPTARPRSFRTSSRPRWLPRCERPSVRPASTSISCGRTWPRLQERLSPT